MGKPPRWSTLRMMLCGLLGGMTGAALVWFFQTRSFSLIPIGMSYADLAATLLSAVSVLVTIIGVFIAILAVWGYSQFKDIAKSAAKEHVGGELKDGELRTHIATIATRYLEGELNSGRLRQLLEERVDHIIYGGAEHRDGKREVREEGSEE